MANEKKISKVRLLVNIHLGGKRYAGKGSVISGSDGWMIDLVHSKQAEAVGPEVKDEIKDLEHVKPLEFTNASNGQKMSEAEIKALTSRLSKDHATDLQAALDAQAETFQAQIDELKKLLKDKGK